MSSSFTCSNELIEANFAAGWADGGTGVVVVVGAGLAVLFELDAVGGIGGGSNCSADVGDSVVGWVKRCSKRLEHNCRRDFFDCFESS